MDNSRDFRILNDTINAARIGSGHDFFPKKKTSLFFAKKKLLTRGLFRDPVGARGNKHFIKDGLMNIFFTFFEQIKFLEL